MLSEIVITLNQTEPVVQVRIDEEDIDESIQDRESESEQSMSQDGSDLESISCSHLIRTVKMMILHFLSVQSATRKLEKNKMVSYVIIVSYGSTENVWEFPRDDIRNYTNQKGLSGCALYRMMLQNPEE